MNTIAVSTPPTRPVADRLWSTLLQRAILPLGDRALGQRMIGRLDFLRRAQWWPRDALVRYRDAALASLINTAYHEVPFYRRLLDSAGVHPSEIRAARDLRKIPVVTKPVLRAAYPGQTTRYTGQKTYEACSSGSTGTPFCVREDSYTAGWYRATFMLTLDWLGWAPGVPHVQTGINPGRGRSRRLKDALLRCHYVSAFAMTDAHLDSTLDHMEAHQIRYMFGYPGSITFLAERALARSLNLPLHGIATWGDTLFPHYRELIERAFQTRVLDQYGCSEGIMIAAQCGHGSHYHVFDTDVILEYLDDDDQPVQPGTQGHLVVTRLHPGPMPLIRYRVGDVGIASGDGICSCGRGFSLMDRLEGRDTDVILTPSGNRLVVHVFNGVLENFKEIGAFQIVQDELSAIRIDIIPATGYNTEVQSRIIQVLRARGVDLDIRIKTVGAVQHPPNGKRRFIINNLLKH